MQDVHEAVVHWCMNINDAHVAKSLCEYFFVWKFSILFVVNGMAASCLKVQQMALVNVM